MVKRTSLEGADCPVARSLDVIGDWWSLLIVRDAFDGLRRFGEFQKSLGMAKNVLAARLRTLVAHDILKTAPVSEDSAYQEYVLTAKGRGLFHVIVSLRQWGEAYSFKPGEAHSTLVDVVAGQPIRKLEVRAEDGRLLGPAEAIVKKLPARAARRARTPGRRGE